MTPALAALLAECEAREPRLVAIIRAMDEDRERMRHGWPTVSTTMELFRQTTARIDALARGEEGS